MQDAEEHLVVHDLGAEVTDQTYTSVTDSLQKRLCSLDETLRFPAEDLQLLTEHTRIHQYKLETALFGLEGSWIRGYTGQVTLRISGPEPLIRFGNMLYGLAPWFGVGIKTTLGMGGCLVSHA